MNIKIYISENTNPWFNLATEDWLFQELDDFDQVLFLWRNADTVVIGRSQNPWLECRLDDMRNDEVLLARRQSGGGAVFHDLGNTNFTFLSKKSHYNKADNLAIITRALQKNWHINAKASGRNDIVVTLPDGSERKISGSAFKEKADRAFHHGTVLVNADMSRLANYLNPDKRKLEAKGIKSVKSRVMNASECAPDINHDGLLSAIITEFCEHYGAHVEPNILSTVTLQNIASLNNYYEKLKSWDWLYGQTLEFTHRFNPRFNWGGVDIQLVVKNAAIKDVRVYSDSLYPDLIEALEQKLQGMSYDQQAINGLFEQLRHAHPPLCTEIEQLQKQIVV